MEIENRKPEPIGTVNKPNKNFGFPSSPREIHWTETMPMESVVVCHYHPVLFYFFFCFHSTPNRSVWFDFLCHYFYWMCVCVFISFCSFLFELSDTCCKKARKNTMIDETVSERMKKYPLSSFLFWFDKEQNTFFEVSYCIHSMWVCVSEFVYNVTAKQWSQWKARLAAISSSALIVFLFIILWLILFFSSWCTSLSLSLSLSLCVCFNYGKFYHTISWQFYCVCEWNVNSCLNSIPLSFIAEIQSIFAILTVRRAYLGVFPYLANAYTIKIRLFPFYLFWMKN